ncbi:MAG: phosphomethylpyrimidine synthase ThiC, partial [Candidatus Omnitrophota bacterium]
MTQLEAARSGRYTPEMKKTARVEGLAPEFIRKGIAKGRIVIPKNSRRHLLKPCAIGEGLSTKINANIGTSKDASNLAGELKKMRAAIKLGSDTIMDLSTGPGLAKTRRSILASCDVPLGTVPIYEIVINSMKRHGAIEDIGIKDIFEVLEAQAEDGVDFFTIHAGVTKKTVEALKENPRVLDIVSRGGAFLAQWIIANN